MSKDDEYLTEEQRGDDSLNDEPLDAHDGSRTIIAFRFPVAESRIRDGGEDGI